jgi:hypothetical protein
MAFADVFFLLTLLFVGLGVLAIVMKKAQAVNDRCLERAPVRQFFPRYLACATANMARSISP